MPNQTAPAVAPVPLQPSLIETMKKTVVFIQAVCIEKDAKGAPIQQGYSATAFLLSFPDPRLAPNTSFTYLVTNKHLTQPGIEKGSPCSPIAYYLRLDLKAPDASGSYTTVGRIPPTAFNWTYSDDPSVDLAITPIGLDTSKLDIIFLPSTLLLSDSDIKQNRVEEGDSTLFTGLFIQLVGQSHSEPIIREGKIAMMPREKVPTTLRSLGDIYLVDCHVFGGNSGSPIFVNLAGQRENGLIAGLNYKLLGVVSGYVKEEASFALQTVAAYAGTLDSNSGVAVVVPAQQLLNLLDAPTLKAQREQTIKNLPIAK